MKLIDIIPDNDLDDDQFLSDYKIKRKKNE